MSPVTNLLANQWCGGSSQKLISGWWYVQLGSFGGFLISHHDSIRYSILVTTAILTITAFAVANANARPVAEGFASIGSAIISIVLSVGGTMILRKFHNSLAVGFFMGSILSTSQMFFTLAMIYMGYAHDQKAIGASAKEEWCMAIVSLLQSVLLGSFALLLTAHRSELEQAGADDGYANMNA